jgi:hypothetical protein
MEVPDLLTDDIRATSAARQCSSSTRLSGKAVSESCSALAEMYVRATGRNGVGTDGHPATHEVADFEADP